MFLCIHNSRPSDLISKALNAKFGKNSGMYAVTITAFRKSNIECRNPSLPQKNRSWITSFSRSRSSTRHTITRRVIGSLTTPGNRRNGLPRVADGLSSLRRFRRPKNRKLLRNRTPCSLTMAYPRSLSNTPTQQLSMVSGRK